MTEVENMLLMKLIIFKECGIIHHIPKAPQSTGIAETKYRTLVDV